MKKSIRSTRFTLGVILFLIFILFLSILSCYYINRLSGKTNAILKENHYSIVYARDMVKYLTNINQEVTRCFITNKDPDKKIIYNELLLFKNSFQLEKNNLTESGEEKLVSDIETSFNEYNDSMVTYIKSSKPVVTVLYLQNKFDNLYHQLMLLSQMNEKAIIEKTDDAQVSAKKASIQMSIIGTLCFLIAYGFTFCFASYFNERFYQLYEGLKEMVSGNYSQKLYFKGKDEVSEISLIFNEMADKLADKNPKKAFTLQDDLVADINITTLR